MSRIDFLVDSASSIADLATFVYLAPQGGASAEDVEAFASRFTNLDTVRFVRADRRDRRQARSAIGSVLENPAESRSATIVIGFGAGGFVPVRGCLAWCVNGIPEERLLHGATPRRKAEVGLAWGRAALALRPKLAVAVSAPMARMIERRTRHVSTIVPNVVDRTVFQPGPENGRQFITYQGGGSPWQGLHRLAEVWRHLHELDRSLRFRVISNDPRTDVLVDAVDSEVIERIAASTPQHVAGVLREARIAFLFREPLVVNEAAFPMKLGEYLASGSPVVVSRCGWDAERIISENRAGLVVDWYSPPGDIAAEVLAELRKPTAFDAQGVARAAAGLDRKMWKERLAQDLLNAHGSLSAMPIR